MPAGTISVAAGANAYEGGSAGSFVLSRTDTTAGQSVNFSFGGTASSSDYAQPLMAYFDVGQASITLTIPAADDSISEPTETIVFTLTPGADYTVGASGSATIDLIDNDPAAPPLVGIAALGVTTAGGPVGTFRITRADPTGPLTVNYVVLTTAGGVSYTVPAFVSFADGQAWVDLVVTPTEGADPTQLISVTITLTPGTGYGVGPADMATVYLFANVAVGAPPAGVVFDLDVNANGSLADPDDLAERYLPGYEGTFQKVSTRTGFNDPNNLDPYTGQRMKLILDGVGTNNANVTRVEFAIVAVSRHEGYASNKTSPTVTGDGKSDDYSFYRDSDYKNAKLQKTFTITPASTSTEQPANNLFQGGQMGATMTWVNFYAKDYGGAARLEAHVYVKDGAVDKFAYGIPLGVPLDMDADGFADKWEIQMSQRWTTQYGLPADTNIAQALARFDVTPVAGKYKDDEKADPDGAGPLVPQAETGDAHDIVEEYRGYILDGGGLNGAGANGHPGGHIRLDPARKEILVEVDRGAGLLNVPNNDLSGIMNGAAKVFSNAQRGAGIYMYYLFDQADLPLPTVSVNTYTKMFDKVSDTRNSTLKSDFLHLLLINEGVNAADIDAGGPGAWAGTYFGPTLARRGAVVGTTDVHNAYPAATFTKRDEIIATTIAHELTHLLLKIAGQPDIPFGFDSREHTKDANDDGNLRDAEDKTCLMYYDSQNAVKSNELATVKFFPLVQAHLSVRTNEGIDP